MSQFPICALRSVDFEVPDLAAAEAFYATVWGLSVWRRDATSAWLHGTGDDPYLLGLHLASSPAIRRMSFRARSEQDLHELAERIVGAGGRIIRTLAPLADDPAGGVGLDLLDLRGRTFRLVHGDLRRHADPPALDRPERLSHVNINSVDTDADMDFFVEGLGFRKTDRSKMMGFVRTNDDHHAIVIADAPVNTLNHVAFMLPSWEGVMRASGRLIDHGFPIAWGVGRHGPGDNVFAYFIDPFGFVVEHTAEVLQVDDGYVVRPPQEWTWPPGRTDHWGIAPPKSDACKRAQLAIPFSHTV